MFLVDELGCVCEDFLVLNSIDYKIISGCARSVRVCVSPPRKALVFLPRECSPRCPPSQRPCTQAPEEGAGKRGGG